VARQGEGGEGGEGGEAGRGLARAAPRDACRVHRRLAVPFCALAAVAGCRSGGSTGAVASSAPSVRTSSVDGPVLRYPVGGNGDALDAPVFGTLELDEGCLYVARTDIGKRYPIVWPYGTTWDATAEVVVVPTGDRLAMGTDVDGGGGFFDVDAVDRIVDAAAEAVARTCLDSSSGEVAFVNDLDDGIGRVPAGG